MKRIFAMVLVAMMASGLAGCWDKAEKKDQNKAESEMQQSEGMNMSAPAEEKAGAEEQPADEAGKSEEAAPESESNQE